MITRNSSPSAIRHGDRKIGAAYLGDVRIWPDEQPLLRVEPNYIWLTEYAPTADVEVFAPEYIVWTTI